jgi:hypothetical protein
VLEVVRAAFPGHAVLGEEGGVSGDVASDFLWCIDPLDGTTNFTHSYPVRRAGSFLSFSAAFADTAVRPAADCSPLRFRWL